MLSNYKQLKALKKDLEIIKENLRLSISSKSSVKADPKVVDSYTLVNKHLVFNGVLTSLEQ